MRSIAIELVRIVIVVNCSFFMTDSRRDRSESILVLTNYYDPIQILLSYSGGGGLNQRCFSRRLAEVESF